MRKVVINALIQAIILIFSQVVSAQPSFVTDSLDAYITREMLRWNIPAVAVAVVYKGDIVYLKGHGVIESGKSEKVNEHTLFQIASNSKAFTGTSVALLDFQKRLSLEDKVKKYLNYFELMDAYATEHTTIRDLLSHRIGFKTFQSDFLNWDARTTRKHLIENMRNVEPVNPFRYEYGYCNVCFLTAGEVVHSVTDTTWDEFIKFHFFSPLEMNRSSTDYQSIATDKNAAVPYTVFDNKLLRLDYAYIDALGPAASINSSASDMAQWMKMQLDTGRFKGVQVFPKEVILATWSPNMLVRSISSKLFPYRTLSAYGLGWFVEDFYGRKILRHGGGTNGFVTMTTLIPGEGAGFVVLTNTDANDFYQALSFQLTEAFTGLPYRNLSEIFYSGYKRNASLETERIHRLWKEAEENHTPRFPLEKYTGTYENPVFGDLEIKIEGNQLVITFEYHPRLKGKLRSLGDNTFLCDYSDVTYGVYEVPFETDSNQVTAVTIKINDFIDYLPYKFIRKQE
ncbi:MAG: serine hydrolase [Bacteroidia bacterium]|nr:serine hydrolase [Bacteroidia bacterium]